MIDYSNLTDNKPNINYDTTPLTSEGYELKFALDHRNPIYKDVIKKCKENNLPFQIKDGEGKQKHIWIKDWE